MRSVLLAVPLVLLLACGGRAGGDDAGDGPDAGGALEGLTALTVTPADQTLIVTSTQAATQAYTATGTFDDGRVEDVTGLVQFRLAETTLGVFAAADLTTATGRGGRTEVIASAGSIAGTTPVTLRLEQTWSDPASELPPDPAAPFGGPDDAARAPSLVYPNDGVVLPPNLGRLELHFRPGANTSLYELTFESPVLALTVYLRCTQPLNGGCIYLPDPQVWAWLAESSRGTEAVTWRIRGTDDEGNGVGTSTSMTLRFAPEDVTGGIYYWTTTLRAIIRYDFATQTQTMAEQFLGTEMSGGTCIGCHALSRDGKKMVAVAGGQNDGRVLLLDVETRTPLVPFASTEKSMFNSWNPDGSAFVGVYGDTGATNFDLMVFDGTTAALTETIPAGGSSTSPTNHPDWSPTGERIAYVNVGIKNTLQKSYSGEIRMVTNTNGTWGAPEVLVPRAAGKHSYYPAFAPDGKMLVFNASTCNSGNQGAECDGDNDPTATLFAIDPAAAGTPTALTRAYAPGIEDGARTALASSFPKWNPNVFRRDAAGGRLAWMTFSSTRKYGLRSPPGNGTLLWMVAVDLDAPAGTDPSAAAFALPFQDLTTSNHIAQWTTKILGPLE